MFWTHEDIDTPALWPYPEDTVPEHIMLVEGESDCGTAHAAGLPFAFSVTKGASGALPPGWADALLSRGAREITICGDADDAGKRFAERATAEALDAGFLVSTIHIDEIVDPFRGVTDLNSLWRLCDTRKEFLQAVERATSRVSSQINAFTFEDMQMRASEDVDWVIPELVAPGDKVLLSGPQKAFKTWIMLDLVRTIADGYAFLNQSVWAGKERRKCLIVEEEGSPHAFARRVTRMGLSPEGQANVYFYHRKGIRFTDPDTISTVLAFCREYEIECVIFDPLQRMIPGVNENDSSETGVVWDEIARLQEAIPGLVCVVVHHAGKSERLTWESVRGSSRHGGEVDLGIFCEKAVYAQDTVRLRIDGRDVHLDMEDGWGFEGKVKITEDTFVIDANQMQIDVVSPQARGQRNTEAILKLLEEGPKTRQEIATEADLAVNTVLNRLNALIEDELVEVVSEGTRGSKKYGLVGSNTDE
jgi:hypothetical protein